MWKFRHISIFKNPLFSESKHIATMVKGPSIHYALVTQGGGEGEGCTDFVAVRKGLGVMGKYVTLIIFI